MELKDITKPAVVISENASFEEVVRAMDNGQTNTVLVTDQNDRLVGEVSVADLLDAIIPEHLDGDAVVDDFATEEKFAAAVSAAKDKTVKDFMSADFSAIETKSDLLTVAATAIGQHRARIPVVDKAGHPVGMISRRGLKHILTKYLGINGK